MKKLFSLPFIMLMMILGLSSLSMAATTPDSALTVWLYKITQPVGSDPVPDPDDKRIPSRPLSCTISQSEGIDFGGYTTEIISYEILEPESEYCMASFSTESDFIDTLFSMPSGEYQLRLITDDYELIGYVAL